MPPSHFLCTQCGAQTSAPVKVAPGSPWVAAILAVPFVIPGIAFALWRHSMRKPACPTCGHAHLIPSDAPLARTWRAAGWIANRPAETSPTQTGPDIRIERIEQAIDAIAGEVERIAQQRPPAALRGERDTPAFLRDRGPITPT